MVENFIRAIKYAQLHVEPNNFDVDIGVDVKTHEELLRLVSITGYTKCRYLEGEYPVHLVQVGNHARLFCRFPVGLNHLNFGPSITCMNNPVVAASVLHGVLGFDRFCPVRSKVSIFRCSVERAVELASGFSFNGETTRQRHNNTRWLSVGPNINIFLPGESLVSA